MAVASHIPSRHKGHGFRYVQTGNKCYLRAKLQPVLNSKLATCIMAANPSVFPTFFLASNSEYGNLFVPIIFLKIRLNNFYLVIFSPSLIRSGARA